MAFAVRLQRTKAAMKHIAPARSTPTTTADISDFQLGFAWGGLIAHALSIAGREHDSLQCQAMRDALRQIGFYAGMILIVLALYVLSAGPVMRLHCDTTIPWLQRGIDVVYFPVKWLAHSGVDGGFLGWYVNLWMRGGYTRF